MRLLNLFFPFIFLLFPTACSNNNDQETELLFTYERPFDTNTEYTILLFDIDGNLLDTSTLDETGVSTLYGSSNQEKFTVAIVKKEEDFFEAICYFNISNSIYKDVQAEEQSLSGRSVLFEIDNDISGLIFFSGKYPDFLNQPNDLSKPYELNSDNNVMVNWELTNNNIPRFIFYPDVQDREVLHIQSKDFVEYSYHKPDYITPNSTLTEMTGRFFNSPEKYTLFTDRSSDIKGFPFPKGVFDYLELTFQLDENNDRRHFFYSFKDLPTNISKIEIGELNLSSKIESYAITSSNPNISLIRSTYTNSSKTHKLVVNGPNVKGLNLSKVLKSITSLFPELHDISIYQRSIFYEAEGNDYLDYVDNIFKTKSSISTIKSYISNP